jgi:hypothetical protein
MAYIGSGSDEPERVAGLCGEEQVGWAGAPRAFRRPKHRRVGSQRTNIVSIGDRSVRIGSIMLAVEDDLSWRACRSIEP